MIEINLTEIHKAERKNLVLKKVTVHGKNKTFQRTQWVRPGEAPKQDREKIAEYESVPGLYGRSPKYESMPKSIRIPEASAKKMQKMSKDSLSKDLEIGCIIKRRKGELFLSRPVEGDHRSIKIGRGEKYGVYHTHPGGPGSVNSFSLADIHCMLTQGKSLESQKLMMAHDCHSDILWCAVASSDTLRIAKRADYKERTDKYLGYKESFESKRWSELEKEVDRLYRNHVKSFCDEYKIKLYYGKPDGELREYDGTW